MTDSRPAHPQLPHRDLRLRTRDLHQHGRCDQARDLLAPLLESEDPPGWILALGACLRLAAGDTVAGQALAERAEAAGPGPNSETGPDAGEESAWASDLGYAWLMLGRHDLAGDRLERATSLPGADAAAWTRLGGLALLRGDLDQADQAFDAALRLDPERAETHVNLAAVLTRQGRYAQALEHYERALELDPAHPQASAGRSGLLVALERADEAVLDLEQRLEEATDPAGRLGLRRQLACILDAAGRLDEAAAQLDAALSEALGNAPDRSDSDIPGEVPGATDTALQLAALETARNRYGAALAALDRGREAAPDDLGLLTMRTSVLAETGKAAKALEEADRAMALHPESPLSRLARAEALQAADDFDAAEADLTEVLEQVPGLARAWAARGHLRLLTGRLDEAVADLRRAAELSPQALAALVEARDFPQDPAVLERMQALADNPLLHRDPRAAMHFALAKVFEARGDHQAAFDAAEAANALLHPVIDHDPDSGDRLAEALERAFTPRSMARMSGGGSDSLRPVFILGMPRSGTTLVERILGAHPKAHAAGELGCIPAVTLLMPRVLGRFPGRSGPAPPYPACMNRFVPRLAAHGAAYYLRKIAAMAPDAARRVVDKLPHNFLHLGLIRLLFPRATVIHIRRDPRDVAVSTLFTNFRLRHGGMSYAYSLADIGRMLLVHQRLMDHWRGLGLDFCELDYEDLVAGPEAGARRLLDMAGLGWDPAVMDFHSGHEPVRTASIWQVRQPVYATSARRWERYADRLGPLLEVISGRLPGM